MFALFLTAAIAIYLSTSASQIFAMYKGTRLPRKRTISALSFASLLAVLPTLAAIYDGYALSLGIFQVFGLVSLTAMLVILMVSIFSPAESLAALMAPVTAAGIGLMMVGDVQPIPVSHYSGGLVTHIIVSVLAYGFLMSAAVQAIIYSVQNNQLHNKKLTGIINVLPPLQTMENILFTFIWLGFVSLGAAVSLGFIYVDDLMAQKLMHKTVLSVLAWAIFGCFLAGKAHFGWRGQRAANITLITYGLLALAYFGSAFVLQFILSK